MNASRNGVLNPVAGAELDAGLARAKALTMLIADEQGPEGPPAPESVLRAEWESYVAYRTFFLAMTSQMKPGFDFGRFALDSPIIGKYGCVGWRVYSCDDADDDAKQDHSIRSIERLATNLVRHKAAEAFFAAHGTREDQEMGRDRGSLVRNDWDCLSLVEQSRWVALSCGPRIGLTAPTHIDDHLSTKNTIALLRLIRPGFATPVFRFLRPFADGPMWVVERIKAPAIEQIISESQALDACRLYAEYVASLVFKQESGLEQEQVVEEWNWLPRDQRELFVSFAASEMADKSFQEDMLRGFRNGPRA